MRRTLCLLFTELAGRGIDATFFDPNSPAFREVPQTTWEELKQAGLIEPDATLGSLLYRLSGKGWLEALHAADEWDTNEMDETVGKLSLHLKAAVKGRRECKLMEVDELARLTGLSKDLVFNCIESNLLEVRTGKRGAGWHAPGRGRYIVIPVTFGIDEVDPQDRLRAEIEALKEQLAYREEQLSEYRCPHCGARLATSGPGDPEGESWFNSYECGHSERDGATTSPCPNGPEFPAFEEYELRFRKGKTAREAWYCYAFPLTPHARLLSLREGFGSTKEAAERMVRQAYDWYAGRRR